MSSVWLPQREAARKAERKFDGTRRGERLTESDGWRIAMKLPLAAIASVLLCLLSLAARSRAMRAAASAPLEVSVTPQEGIALSAVDGRLRARLRKLAKAGSH